MNILGAKVIIQTPKALTVPHTYYEISNHILLKTLLCVSLSNLSSYLSPSDDRISIENNKSAVTEMNKQDLHKVPWKQSNINGNKCNGI